MSLTAAYIIMFALFIIIYKVTTLLDQESVRRDVAEMELQDIKEELREYRIHFNKLYESKK